MAFSVTYHHLAKHNIRNIYGGLPQEIRLRKSCNIEAISPPQRNIEIQKRPPTRYQVKFSEYNSEYDILVPKAPAFRILNRAQVDEIVKRVSRTTNSKTRPLETCPKEAKRSSEDTCIKCKASKFPRKVRDKEMACITKRLLRPTASANVRTRMRSPDGFTIDDLRFACHRQIVPYVKYAMEREHTVA